MAVTLVAFLVLMLELAQARATALAAPAQHDALIVEHIDTSVARLRAQLARLMAA